MLCLCMHVMAMAQQPVKSNQPYIAGYSVLNNNQLGFTSIVNNDSLPFVKNGLLTPSQGAVYWFKINIANPALLSGRYIMYVAPAVYNTIFYFDARTQKWLSNTGGNLVTPPGIKTPLGSISLELNPQPVNVVYVQMNLSAVSTLHFNLKPRITITDAAISGQQLDFSLYWWVAALAVLVFFFLYNLYMYISFKDASVLYYLIMQVGAMVYISTYIGVFKHFLPNRVFSIVVKPNANVFIYDIDNVLQHAFIILIMYGFIQLTRSYLNTRRNLPKVDRLLRYSLYIYAPVSVALIVINMAFFYIDGYTLLYDNLFLLLQILLIVYTCAMGYRLKLRAAGPFLLANVLPLVFMLFITVFHLLVSMETSQDNIWLPSLAIASQSFCFSVAFVTRTRLLQQDLNAKQLEAQQLNFEVQKISISMQVERTRSELLKERLDANQRELASTTLYMVQKNELLANLKNQIEELNRLYPKHPHNKLSGMESILKSSLSLDDDWQKFKLHFEQVHPGFFENLAAKHPTLTKNETRLYAYFHINLSPKEIASLLNIEPDSVRRAKSRLLKKMGLADMGEDAPGTADD